MRRAPRAIRRVLALRHDAFEPHLARVGEEGRAVAFQMLVEAQAKASFGQHTSKCGLAHFQRLRLADDRSLHKSEVPGTRFSLFIIRYEPKPENSDAPSDHALR